MCDEEDPGKIVGVDDENDKNNMDDAREEDMEMIG